MDRKAEDSYTACAVSARDAESGIKDGRLFHSLP